MSAICSKMDLCKGKLTKATRKGQNTIAPISLSQAGLILKNILKICFNLDFMVGLPRIARNVECAQLSRTSNMDL